MKYYLHIAAFITTLMLQDTSCMFIALKRSRNNPSSQQKRFCTTQAHMERRVLALEKIKRQLFALEKIERKLLALQKQANEQEKLLTKQDKQIKELETARWPMSYYGINPHHLIDIPDRRDGDMDR
jgi:hypothetical protein